MNVSSYVPMEVSSTSFHSLALSFTPNHIWGCYMQYLWNYGPSSWVARIALLYKVLAIILVLPMAILGMLDVSSYVVARTLGVVDVVKASTNAPIDHPPVRSKSRSDVKSRSRDPPRDPPTIVVSSPPLTPNTSRFHTASETDDATTRSSTPPSETETGEHTETDAVVSEEEADGLAQLSQLGQSIFSNEALAGVGVFSPATSRPPSPTLSRFKPLPSVVNVHMSEEEAAGVRRRRKYSVAGSGTGSSPSGTGPGSGDEGY
ncbi:hypothetical protein FIBSPDRAFT_880707 [Athelia psychrophila]|uniref:Uncharacterized protein n=1 Tax=Athelia psychrophila TaxID=1759441 RepID=A0A166HDV1_9AGAM|nr:hypothetical protein FIBSPDRAFT_893340 [Fibularhizoctonia sp. CBS 109695]KZP34129.1 hypothetical protein FIBSPDRAFT_880707 [Fibularhizoctonia sp. CBS 109695]